MGHVGKEDSAARGGALETGAGRDGAQGRLWIRRGSPDCVHYWVGAGERSGGRERFECRRCGAVMAEPLALSPVRGRHGSLPPGFVSCSVCGTSSHWTRTVRNPGEGRGRVCLECLQKIGTDTIFSLDWLSRSEITL